MIKFLGHSNQPIHYSRIFCESILCLWSYARSISDRVPFAIRRYEIRKRSCVYKWMCALVDLSDCRERSWIGRGICKYAWRSEEIYFQSSRSDVIKPSTSSLFSSSSSCFLLIKLMQMYVNMCVCMIHTKNTKSILNLEKLWTTKFRNGNFAIMWISIYIRITHMLQWIKIYCILYKI